LPAILHKSWADAPGERGARGTRADGGVRPTIAGYFCFAVIFFSSAFIRRLSTSAGIG
jgi:hypothetical protein